MKYRHLRARVIGALLLVITGLLTGCGVQDPVGSSGGELPPNCVRIGDVIHCT